MLSDRASLLVGAGSFLMLSLLVGACSGDKTGERDAAGGMTGSNSGGNGSSYGGGSATGGGGGGGLVPYPCNGVKPDTAEMTKTLATDGKWGGTGFSGGTFTYGDGPDADTATDITMTFEGGALHIKGNVATYTGFGLWFAPIGMQKSACVDASDYKGVSFEFTDNSTTTPSLQVSIQSHGDAPIDVANSRGACAYSDPAKKYSECVYPSTSETMPEGGGVVEVPFTKFMNGKPEATVKPAELDGLQWQFPWMEGSTAYQVDITITNLKFY